MIPLQQNGARIEVEVQKSSRQFWNCELVAIHDFEFIVHQLRITTRTSEVKLQVDVTEKVRFQKVESDICTFTKQLRFN
jgi:hypothetical protein